MNVIQSPGPTASFTQRLVTGDGRGRTCSHKLQEARVHQCHLPFPESQAFSVPVLFQVTNRGEAHLELNAFRRKHDCALVISGDSLEVSAGSLWIGYLFLLWVAGRGWHRLMLPASPTPCPRFASSTMSMSSWSWPASAQLLCAAAVPLPRRPRSCDCSRNALESSPAQWVSLPPWKKVSLGVVRLAGGPVLLALSACALPCRCSELT